MDQLDTEQIKRNLHVSPLPSVQVFKRIDSTQTYCLQRHLINPQIVAADEQSQGRGQRGHRFYSPQASGLYMTVVLPASERLIRNPGVLTAGAGVAVVKALTLFTNQKMGLKWMNDVEYRHRKCGGILVETNSDSVNRIQSWVIGIGLDLYPHEFPREIRNRAGYLFRSSPRFSRNRLIAQIYQQLIAIFQNDHQQIIKMYRHFMVWVHRKVTFYLAGQLKSGIILGIDHRARLMVRGPDHRVYHLNYQSAEQIRLV